MRSLVVLDDAMGRPTLAIGASDIVYAVLLASGVARQVAVPAGANVVLFNATGPFWAKIGAQASLPLADVLDGSAPELRPAARRIDGAAVIGLVAPASTVVNLAFYR